MVEEFEMRHAVVQFSALAVIFTAATVLRQIFRTIDFLRCFCVFLKARVSLAVMV